MWDCIFIFVTIWPIKTVIQYSTTLLFRTLPHEPGLHYRHSRHGLLFFHHRHMLLSHVMLSAWFVSTYLQHYCILRLPHQYFTQNQTTLANAGSTLRSHTDEYQRPVTMRDSHLNKLLFSELSAYVAKPTKHVKTTFFDSDSFEVCVDSGASSTCTMERNDFLPDTFQPISGHVINGISSGLEVLGVGTVRWVIHNDDLEPIDVEIERTLLIRDLPMRLLCPQQLARQTGGLWDGFLVGSDSATLTYGGYRRTIQYKSGNNLPIFSSFPGCSHFTSYSASIVGDGSLRDTLTYPQRKLLKWHRRLGHIGFHKVQQFSRLGLLPKELSSVRPDEYPICPACQYGKQKCSYRHSDLTTNALSASDNHPGDCISVDMIHSPFGGLIPQSRGQPRIERYHYACIFVDHATQLTYVTLQLTQSAEETVESKHAFEAYAASHGVRIKKYHADNGAFNTRLFKESVIAAHQQIDFCGVYVHHQNSIAERMIQTITFRA